MDLSDLLGAAFPLPGRCARSPLGRAFDAAILIGFLSVIPAALIAGSGGHGDGFDAFTFGVIVVACVTVAATLAAVTAPGARRHPGDDEPG